MQNIPIQAIPNQQFNIVLDDNRWDITIKSTKGTVSVTLIRNGQVIVSNARAVAGMRIIPAIYQEAGNFAIISQNQSIPEYSQFGVSQFMLYLSEAELDLIRIPPAVPIQADFFDPLGALPLRYAPVGYELAP